MNLHGIAGPVIAAVNPMIPVGLKISLGQSLPAPDGTLVPRYSDEISVTGQIQPVTWGDLQMLDGINLGGVRWKIYLHGEINGVVRPEKKGGDIVIVRGGRHQGEWLTVQVLEQFPDWVCAAIVLQTAAPTPGDGLTADLTDEGNTVIVPSVMTGV